MVLKNFLLIIVIFIAFSCATNDKNTHLLEGKAKGATLQADNTELFKAWKLPSYFFLVDGFVDGNKKNNINVNRQNVKAYQGGDLEGVIKKFPYFSQLHIGTLLTTPLTQNRRSDFFGHWGAHGYWIIDHDSLDEHWGTMEDLKTFTDLRVKNDKKFLLDLVLNHVDWDHPWVKAHPDWFHKLGDIKDWNNASEKELTEGQVSGLPDLDQDNPEVYKKLLDYSKKWIALTQADGIRLDAVKHIDHTFWKFFLADIKKEVAKKDFLFLVEMYHGDPNAYVPYLEDGFNAFYDYPLYFSVADVFGKHQSMFKLPARLQYMDKLFGNKILWATFIDNHDTPRFLSLDQKTDFEDAKQALTFYMTTRGMPIIYSGIEDRMKGKTGEEGRKMLTFSRQKDIDDVARLSKLRSDLSSLSDGLREDLKVSETLYVFRKVNQEEETLVILNRAKEPGSLILELEDDSLFAKQKSVPDQLNRFRVFNIKDKKLTLFLRKRDAIILTLKGKSDRYEKIQAAKPILKSVKVFVDAELAEGESLYMVGANQEIGAWNADKAFGPFEAVLGNKYGAEIEIPEGAIVEYKFIKKDSANKVTWENGENHFFFVDKNAAQIRRSWNSH